MEKHSGIVDSGALFKVIPHKRIVKVPSSHKVIGTVGEHMSEAITFQVDKIIEGHDIKGCAEHYISWKNANGEERNDPLDLVNEDADFLYYAWKIRGETTEKAGIVSFSLHFEDFSEDGNPIYAWGTSPCTDCEILDCINAPVATYQAIYIDGDTLVFADYTPVRDGTIMVETAGIVPEGSMTIETNGHHDVGLYAGVDVAVPRDYPFTLELQEDGLMVATDGVNTTLTHQLETPDIAIVDGTVTAAANGLESELPLETPTIAIDEGKITAAANGLEAEHPLETPTIAIDEGKITAAANGLEAEHQLEPPVIEIVEGKVTATANGLEAEEIPLAPPKINIGKGTFTVTANGMTLQENILVRDHCKRTNVSLYHNGGGQVTLQNFPDGTNGMKDQTFNLSTEYDNPTHFTPIAGSKMYFVPSIGASGLVTVDGMSVNEELRLADGVTRKFATVPTVADNAVVVIRMD